MDQYLVQAREIFTKICPDEEFMAVVPHPEDIIYVCSLLIRTFVFQLFKFKKNHYPIVFDSCASVI